MRNSVPTAAGCRARSGYTLCPDTLNFGTYDRANTLPYTVNYDLDIHSGNRARTCSIDIGYVGNRGRHAVVPIPFNAPGIADGDEPWIWGQTVSYGFEVLNQNKCGSVYCDYAPIAGELWNTEDGGNTDFRTPSAGTAPERVVLQDGRQLGLPTRCKRA